MVKKYNIITDPIYGFYRIDPIPTQEEVEKYYSEEFYSSNNNSFHDSSLEVQKAEQEFFDSRWESISNECCRYFGKTEGVSLFDVGFGFAQALLYFNKKGMKVSGLEPSPEGVAYAKSKGLDVYHAGIEDFDCVGTQRFDVVTLINVIEHLRNPAETLLKVKNKLLKPNGLLVLDAPNDFNDFQVIGNKEYNLNEWWVFPPRHINYFTASSLKSFIGQCGYKLWHCEASFPLDMFLLLGDVYIGNPSLGKQCHQKRVNFEHLMKKFGKAEKLRKFYMALAELDFGRHVVVFATPQSI